MTVEWGRDVNQVPRATAQSSSLSFPGVFKWNSNTWEDWGQFSLDHLILRLGSFLKRKRPAFKLFCWPVEINRKQRESWATFILSNNTLWIPPFFPYINLCGLKRAVFWNTDWFPFWGFIRNCLLWFEHYPRINPFYQGHWRSIVSSLKPFWSRRELMNPKFVCSDIMPRDFWYHIA